MGLVTYDNCEFINLASRAIHIYCENGNIITVEPSGKIATMVDFELFKVQTVNGIGLYDQSYGEPNNLPLEDMENNRYGEKFIYIVSDEVRLAVLWRRDVASPCSSFTNGERVMYMGLVRNK